MTTRIHIAKPVLDWAIARSGKDKSDFFTSHPWLESDSDPTLAELKKFAKSASVAYGYLFATEPPVETLPVPDFRTKPKLGTRKLSADLLDTIYACQERQQWYREHLVAVGEKPLDFVGSVRAGDDVVVTAQAIADELGFEVGHRASLKTWRASYNELRDRAEDAGVLVMTNGMVGLNTHRPLNVEEFRGFALVDEFAPVVFINSKDTLAARIFTLAHELAHVWSGQSGVSNESLVGMVDSDVEAWCNRVASELLVPRAAFERAAPSTPISERELERLAADFKVSTLVILRRLADTDHITWDEYVAAYPIELERVKGFTARQTGGRGPSPIKMAPIRASQAFTTALLADTLEGRTTYRDALGMLGFKEEKSLQKVAANLGIG